MILTRKKNGAQKHIHPPEAGGKNVEEVLKKGDFFLNQ